MQWRRISEAEVEVVLKEPERTETARKGRKHVWKSMGERKLRVTYREETRCLVIVTVVDKRD